MLTHARTHAHAIRPTARSRLSPLPHPRSRRSEASASRFNRAPSLSLTHPYPRFKPSAFAFPCE
eukprot:3236173-Pleurochrysis_carterae.AAC.1